ncbi:MAG: hypothetical protein NTY53_06865, partial [Kiritimatiellaeota bacterium]|nr:hypothetical protein [Kiritimatiellota bacterium]
MDLEDEAGEDVGVGLDHAVGDLAGARRGSVLEEAIEQELDAEVVRGAAEEDGRGVAGEHGLGIEGGAGVVQHREFLGDAVEHVVINALADHIVGEAADGDW